MEHMTGSSKDDKGLKEWHRWLPALYDQDEITQGLAAQALGDSEDPEAIPPLLAAMEQTYGMIAGGGVLARALVDLRAVWSAEAFIKTLSDARVYVRRASAEALGWLRDERAVQALVDALGDESIGVRIEASWALGEIGDLAAVSPLVRAMCDEDPNVRRSVADSLGTLGDPKARPALEKALSDQDGGVRAAAEGALTRLLRETG